MAIQANRAPDRINFSTGGEGWLLKTSTLTSLFSGNPYLNTVEGFVKRQHIQKNYKIPLLSEMMNYLYQLFLNHWYHKPGMRNYRIQLLHHTLYHPNAQLVLCLSFVDWKVYLLE